MRSRPMGRNRTAVVGMVTSSHFNMLGLKSKGSLIGNEFGVNPPRPIINPEFADLFYAYGVLDSGRFIGESSHLVGLGSNQASFYLRA